MPRGKAVPDVDQVPDETAPDLAAAKAEADGLTTRILELREAYYERDATNAINKDYDINIRHH